MSAIVGKPLIFARESICSCGFPCLSTDIKLGTEYFMVCPVQMVEATYACGGCGRKQKIQAIKVTRPGDKGPGWLPADLFESNE